MYELVRTDDALADLCERLSRTDWLALDTEFVRETTYWPKLCLVQVGDREGLVACVDILALESLDPLLDLLWREDLTKVYHSGSQDLELLNHLRGPLPPPVFDTQVAAALTGDDDQIGYAAAVAAHTGIQLAKAHTRTDWCRRPLSESELEYAADDVRYLPALHDRLCEELERLGRGEWAAIESARLADPARFASDPGSAWKRVKGLRDADGRTIAVVQRLAQWREETAMRQDRPRRWILDDVVLMSIAHSGTLDDAPPAVVRKHGETLRRLVAEGMDAPMADAAAQRGMGRAEKDRVDAMLKRVRAIAAELRIAPAMLATRKDCEALVRGERPAALVEGWRAEIIGRELVVLATGA